MQGLTLSLAMFFLFVFVPGYIGLWAAGRLGEAQKKFYPVLCWGAINFSVVVLLFLIISQNNAGVFLATLSGNYDTLTGMNILWWMIVFFVPSLFVGFVQFLDDTCFGFTGKRSVAWRSFWLKNKVIEISPRDDIFREIFLCYRITGRRPLVEVSLNKENIIKGEILKMSWGAEPGLLLSNMDNPENIALIPIAEVNLVKFINSSITPEHKTINHKTRKLLNMIHPGYGDEVEEKYRN